MLLNTDTTSIAKLSRINADCEGVIANLGEKIIFPCCDHTLRILDIRKKGRDYPYLLSLSDTDFQALQNSSLEASYNHLRELQGFVSCRICNTPIESHREAYINCGQFSHRGKCSSEYYDKNVPLADNFLEIKVSERLAKQEVSRNKYYIEYTDYGCMVIHKGGYAWASSSHHGDITILHGDGSIALKENEEILIFFKLVRYLLNQGVEVESIIKELSQNDRKIVLVTNHEVLKNYEIFIEDAFSKPEDEYLIEHSNSMDCPYDFLLAESIQEALGKLLALIAISKGQRRASMLKGLQDIKNGNISGYFVADL